MVRKHINRARQKYDNARQKAHELAHPRTHEYFGAGAAAGAVILLILGGMMGSVNGGWDVVWFYVSVIMAAAIFPIKEHDELGHSYASMYMIVMLVLVAASSLWTCITGGMLGFQCAWSNLWTPASLTLLFGATMAYAIDVYEWSHSEFGKVNAVFMVLFVSIAFLHGVPWEEINNGQGTIPETGMALRAATQPLADAARNGATLVGDCITVNFDECRRSAGRVWSNISTFVASLPFGDQMLAGMQYFTDRSMRYVDGMSCIGSQGGLFGIAYQNPALSGNYEPGGEGQAPYQDVQGCFGSEDGAGTPSGPGGGNPDSTNSVFWNQLEVRSGTAILSFDKQMRGGSVSVTRDFDISASSGSLAISGASVSGSTVRLSLSVTPSAPRGSGGTPSQGSDVTVTITGEVEASDGSTLSGGSCTDGYADGSASSC